MIPAIYGNFRIDPPQLKSYNFRLCCVMLGGLLQ